MDLGGELYQAGRDAMEHGELERAIELFRRSAAVYPHFKALELWGECHLRREEWTAAIVPLAAAATLNPQPRAPALLARALQRAGDPRRAREAARLALSRSPTNRLALEILRSMPDPDEGR